MNGPLPGPSAKRLRRDAAAAPAEAKRATVKKNITGGGGGATRPPRSSGDRPQRHSVPAKAPHGGWRRRSHGGRRRGGSGKTILGRDARGIDREVTAIHTVRPAGPSGPGPHERGAGSRANVPTRQLRADGGDQIPLLVRKPDNRARLVGAQQRDVTNPAGRTTTRSRPALRECRSSRFLCCRRAKSIHLLKRRHASRFRAPRGQRPLLQRETAMMLFRRTPRSGA